MNPKQFQKQILTWFDQFGRHDLPWQQNPTPYRVWVSEIMLQQTQVNTVIPYYEKFMRSFPKLADLANAPIDSVLHHWSGLGYYARARNLHAAAKIIQTDFGGIFPNSIEELENLPGIGRSTAGAIASLAMHVYAPILDGNVKRVFCRSFAVEGWPEINSVKKGLWEIAEKYLPKDRPGDFNQALMDLGATLCTRSAPSCPACPLQKNCEAYLQGKVQQYPFKKPKSTNPTKQVRFLIFVNSKKEILLTKRPNLGIWGGLWSFPECDLADDLAGFGAIKAELPPLTHIFSHFKLIIHPVILQSKKLRPKVMESQGEVWYKLDQDLPGGVAAPITKLLTKVRTCLE